MSAIVIVASYCHHTVFSHHLHLALYIIGQLRRITQMTPFFFDLLENISYLINSSGDKLHCLLYALSFVVGRETKKKESLPYQLEHAHDHGERHSLLTL